MTAKDSSGYDKYIWSIYNFIDFKKEQWTKEGVEYQKFLDTASTDIKSVSFADNLFSYTNETLWDLDKSCFEPTKTLFLMFPDSLRDSNNYNFKIGIGISPFNIMSFAVYK